jgi:uncharacterized protein (TIGR02757 family)
MASPLRDWWGTGLLSGTGAPAASRASRGQVCCWVRKPSSGHGAILEWCVRRAELKRRLDDLYAHYDARFVDPDPVQFVRIQTSDADREVVGLIASALAYGNVKQIKRSISAVCEALGAAPAQAVMRVDPISFAERLSGFKHRFNTGRDVACLVHYIGQMLESHGSIEAFFAAGHDPSATDVGPGLVSFVDRTLALSHGGLYGRSRALPASARVRFFFPSPRSGSACKRLNLYLRWMVRRGGVDLGCWFAVSSRQLVIPLDAHVIAIARRVRLTRYRVAGWPMAVDITARLRRLDPLDPVKYDFAFHRMGLWKKHDEIDSLRTA